MYGFDCMYANALHSVSTRNCAYFDIKHVVSECLKYLLLVQQIIDIPRFPRVASLKNEICPLFEAYQFLMPESEMYFSNLV